MPEKLLIVMVNTDPSDPPELGAPFFQATAAAALDYAVEVILAGGAGLLARKGVAAAITILPGSGTSVYGFIKDAHQAGVRFLVCDTALGPHHMTRADLIPEIQDIVDDTYIVMQAMSDGVVTFTY